MDWLDLLEDLGLLAAIGAAAAPGTDIARVASLAGSVSARLARALREARNSGVDLSKLRVPSLEEMVAERTRPA